MSKSPKGFGIDGPSNFFPFQKCQADNSLKKSTFQNNIIIIEPEKEVHTWYVSLSTTMSIIASKIL